MIASFIHVREVGHASRTISSLSTEIMIFSKLSSVSHPAPLILRHHHMKKRLWRKQSSPSQSETSVITDAVGEVDRERQADGELTHVSHCNHDFEHPDSGRPSLVLGPRRLC